MFDTDINIEKRVRLSAFLRDLQERISIYKPKIVIDSEITEITFEADDMPGEPPVEKCNLQTNVFKKYRNFLLTSKK